MDELNVSTDDEGPDDQSLTVTPTRCGEQQLESRTPFLPARYDTPRISQDNANRKTATMDMNEGAVMGYFNGAPGTFEVNGGCSDSRQRRRQVG